MRRNKNRKVYSCCFLDPATRLGGCNFNVWWLLSWSVRVGGSPVKIVEEIHWTESSGSGGNIQARPLRGEEFHTEWGNVVFRPVQESLAASKAGCPLHQCSSIHCGPSWPISRFEDLHAICEHPILSWQGSCHSWVHLHKDKETVPGFQSSFLILLNTELVAWGGGCALPSAPGWLLCTSAAWLLIVWAISIPGSL